MQFVSYSQTKLSILNTSRFYPFGTNIAMKIFGNGTVCLSNCSMLDFYCIPQKQNGLCCALTSISFTWKHYGAVRIYG